MQAVTTNCGAHASYLNCGPNCETTCATLGQKCSIVHIRCPDGCFCNEGYARNSKNECIPIEECQKKDPKRKWKCMSVAEAEKKKAKKSKKN